MTCLLLVALCMEVASVGQGCVAGTHSWDMLPVMGDTVRR